MARPSHPAVLVLIADDWSPIANCYGNRVIRTPSIDAFARDATVFDHGFCTTPSCAASRANLLTGLYAHQHGQYGHSHDPHGFRTHEDVRSLPAVLRDADVFTGLIGKHHIAPMSVYPFDVSEFSSPWSSGALDADVRRFLEQASGRPFYLQVASMYPHRAGPGGGRFPAEMPFTGLGEDVTYDPADVIVPPFLPDAPEVRQDLADYYRFVTRYDGFIGTMLQALRDAGRWDDTLILVMSDHGMPFPGAKASSFEGGHHCPLIVRRPDVTDRPARCDALVNWTDIAPTVYDWFDVPAAHRPADLPGRSFLSAMTEPSPAGWDRTFYSHCFHEVTNYYPYRVVRTRRYKLVRNIAHELTTPIPSDLFRSPTWQAVRQRGLTQMGQRPTGYFLHQPAEALYDLEADPAEGVNRIDDPALSGTVAELRQALIDFRVRTNDPWLEASYQAGEPGVPNPSA